MGKDIIILNNLVKTYIYRFFNLKFLSLNEKFFHRYKRIKLRRFSAKKIILSKIYLKHYNNMIYITFFSFNNQKRLLINQLRKLDIYSIFNLNKSKKNNKIFKNKKKVILRLIKLYKAKEIINKLKFLLFFFRITMFSILFKFNDLNNLIVKRNITKKAVTKYNRYEKYISILLKVKKAFDFFANFIPLHLDKKIQFNNLIRQTRIKKYKKQKNFIKNKIYSLYPFIYKKINYPILAIFFNLSILYWYTEIKKDLERLIKNLHNKLFTNKIYKLDSFKFIRHYAKSFLFINLIPVLAFFFTINLLKKRLLKKVMKSEISYFRHNKMISINKFKHTLLLLNMLSFILSVICKTYVSFSIIEQKAIFLNSELLASSVAIKLRDRKNRVLRIFKKVIKRIKIPSKFVLLRNNNTIMKKKIKQNKNRFVFSVDKEDIYKVRQNYILTSMQYKNISGVRLEGAGRLTRRLTASRSIYKLKYTGSLKNLNSSFKSVKSCLLRGYVKSNIQYTLINSKTRNGAHGIKIWVSTY